MAGGLLAALGGGAAALGGDALLSGLAEAATPEHQRPMTQEAHAQRSWANTPQGLSGRSLQDAALSEGLRQGVMAGKITPEAVSMMVATGKLPQGVVRLMADWIDITAHVPHEVLTASVMPAG